MRIRKETVGSIKEGTRSKGRNVARTNVKGGVKMSGRTSGSPGTDHGSLSRGIPKPITGKGRTSR